MATYLSPGVYVHEVPSAVQPIAGVGTSTAGFIGVFATPDSSQALSDKITADGRTKMFRLRRYPADATPGKLTVDPPSNDARLLTDSRKQISYVSFDHAPTTPFTVKYSIQMLKQNNQKAEPIDKDAPTVFSLKAYPVDTTLEQYQVYVANPLAVTTITPDKDNEKNILKVTLGSTLEGGAKIRATYTVKGKSYSEQIDEVSSPGNTFTLNTPTVDAGSLAVWDVKPATNAKLLNDPESRTTLVLFDTSPGTDSEVYVDFQQPLVLPPTLADPAVVKLCTSFADFRQWFGDFSLDMGQRRLAHAVYGFFLNGGSRCYVARATTTGGIRHILDEFEKIDEIAIVAAPGIVDKTVWADITAHCTGMGDRFAIFDGPEEIGASGLDLTQLAKPTETVLPPYSDYAAYYFPWIQVFDPFSEGSIFVPPSGHMAGIYARVDSERGVHKAPANETVMGALGLKYIISRNQQDGLNPQGVNCIRELNGNIRVWGARTLGGDVNAEFKYINVRRLFLYLRKSIDHGTQWVVFEPNEPALWAKISRNITAFLTNVWRDGALFGNTPQEAFYVKCDASTNSPELRDLGQVTTEIGVAVVRPAEFVVFNLTQMAGPGK